MMSFDEYPSSILTQQKKPESWKQFLYNNETSEFLGRTASSWAKIIAFYAVFYGVLVGFSLGYYALFNLSIDPLQPKYKLSESCIGNNPGLGYRPTPPDPPPFSEGHEYTLNKIEKEENKQWILQLDNFFADYIRPSKEHKENVDNECSYDKPPSSGKVCPVDVSDEIFKDCTRSNDYGYSNSAPCVILKLNKIIDWQPDCYKESELPKELKNRIVNKTEINDKQKKIWLSCYGKLPKDEESMGSIQYIPQQGFPAYYYPYTNQKGYLAPFVAVKFNGLKTGVVINIECRAWAKHQNDQNIIYDHKEEKGLVQFHLQLT